jgi:hypothetical protein
MYISAIELEISRIELEISLLELQICTYPQLHALTLPAHHFTNTFLCLWCLYIICGIFLLCVNKMKIHYILFGVHFAMCVFSLHYDSNLVSVYFIVLKIFSKF